MSFSTKIRLFGGVAMMAVPLCLWWYSRTHRPTPQPLPPRKEINITIFPGWNLRQVADDWVKKGLVKTPEELFVVTGIPAADYRTHAVSEPVTRLVTSTDFDDLLGSKPTTVSYEGYFFPETYRVYADAKPEEIIRKILTVFRERIPQEWYEEVRRQNKSFFEILTMASILEDEGRTAKDRALIADILWRRLGRGMRLQVDSSVHYISARTGDVFTTKQERASGSPWNTYKFSGLPLGPIGNPSLESIKAAIFPTKNTYWYFLTGTDGVMHYAETFEKHTANRFRYLK